MVQAIACDQKKMIPCSVMMDGEYGLKDICIGVPCIIGKNGIEKIVALELTEAEKTNMKVSADAVREVNNLLNL
jgi:malate dehydrogenase